MPHDSQLCAALGHFIGQVAVIYCPHHQAWTIVHRAGDDADDEYLDGGTFEFGPFDTHDDVAKHAGSLVSMLVRVRARQWVTARRAATEGPADGELEEY